MTNTPARAAATLILPALLSLAISAAVAAGPTYVAATPTAAEIAQLKKRGIELDRLQFLPVKGFPEVIMVRRMTPDGGPRFDGGFVSGALYTSDAADPADDGWNGLTRAVLAHRGWSRLAPAGRKGLALTWVLNGLPSGVVETLSEDGGRAPTVAATPSGIVVRVWVDTSHQTHHGHRLIRADAPTTYVFGPDGRVSEPDGDP